MAKIRTVPKPVVGTSGQPEQMRFKKTARLVIDGIDWRCVRTDGFGHILAAEHDKDFKRTYTHAQMKVEAGKIGFRHDPDWYSTEAAKVRLRADVSEMNELPFMERQKILWRESFVREFERLEAAEPDKVSLGEEPLKAALLRIDETVRSQTSKVEDNGRRSYAGRVKICFDKPSLKSFRTWLKLYRDADRDPLALRPGWHKSGNFDERLTEEQTACLREFSQQYLSRTKPSIHGLWSKMKAELEQNINPQRKKDGLAPIKVPSYGRFRKEIDEMDEFEKIAGREGIEEAIRRCQAYGDGVVDVERALQEVEIDHWTVGLRTILTRTGVWPRLNRASRRRLTKVRMVLGAAICRRTHCILGMILSRTPSVESAVRLIEMVVSDKRRFAEAAGCKTPYDVYGVPERILFDGGPAFNNGEMRAILRDLSIDWDIPPGGVPHLRGMIERFFRTLDDQVLSWFEGRTFSDVVTKGNYDPDERAGTSVEELGQVLIRYVVDRHHNKPMKALGGETPREAYLRLTKEFGVCPAPDADKLRNVFGIDIKRVVGPGGIRFLNVQYRSKILHDHFLKAGGAELMCRVHPANIGAISVRIGKSWLTVKGPKEFDSVDAETWIAAEAAIRAKMKVTETTITGPIINAALLEAVRVADVARRRADISDSPTDRKKLLATEARMRVFANFPEDRKDDGVEPSVNIYETATKVGGGNQPGPQDVSEIYSDASPRAARRKNSAKKPRRAGGARKRAPQRKPGLKRTFTAED